MKEIIYDINIIWTILLGGIMTMYCVTLGRYFTYIAKNNMLDGFTKYYSVFRKNTNVQKVFFIFLIGQFIMAIISIILNSTKDISLQIPSILGLIIIILGHSISGFLKSEEKINSGDIEDKKVVGNYIKYNISLHIIYAIYYILAGALLIYIR